MSKIGIVPLHTNLPLVAVAHPMSVYFPGVGILKNQTMTHLHQKKQHSQGVFSWGWHYNLPIGMKLLKMTS